MRNSSDRKRQAEKIRAARRAASSIVKKMRQLNEEHTKTHPELQDTEITENEYCRAKGDLTRTLLGIMDKKGKKRKPGQKRGALSPNR